MLNENLLIGLAPHMPGAISVTLTKPKLERNFDGMSTIFPFGLYVLEVLSPGFVVVVVVLLLLGVVLCGLSGVSCVEVFAQLIVHGGGNPVTIYQGWRVVGVDSEANDSMCANVDVPFNVEVGNVWEERGIDNNVVVAREGVGVGSFASWL